MDFRLSKRPSRERLYILLHLTCRLTKPDCFTTEEWPIPTDLLESIRQACKQHLPLITCCDTCISKQDKAYLARFIGDLGRGQYCLKKPDGAKIACSGATLKDAGITISEPITDGELTTVLNHVATVLGCSVKHVVHFARNAKGQRLIHYFYDRTLVACAGQDVIPSTLHMDAELCYLSGHGIAATLTTLGFRTMNAIGVYYILPIQAVAEVTPHFLRAECSPGSEQFTGPKAEPYQALLHGTFRGNPVTLFTLPDNIIRPILDAIEIHLTNERHLLLKIALQKKVMTWSLSVSQPISHEQRYQLRIGLNQVFLMHGILFPTLQKTAVLDAVLPADEIHSTHTNVQATAETTGPRTPEPLSRRQAQSHPTAPASAPRRLFKVPYAPDPELSHRQAIELILLNVSTDSSLPPAEEARAQAELEAEHGPLFLHTAAAIMERSPPSTPPKTAPPSRPPASEPRSAAHRNPYKTPPRRPKGDGSPHHPATTGRIPMSPRSPWRGEPGGTKVYEALAASARRRRRVTTPGNSPGDN